jgi:hypothetical protein
VCPFPWPSYAPKSEQWAYEQEVRIVRALADCQPTGHVLRSFPIFVQPIPVGAIKSVILGERTPIAVLQDRTVDVAEDRAHLQ